LQGFPHSVDGYTKIAHPYTSEALVRTNIDIDDRLMRQAMRSSGARTKRAAVEEALRLLIQTKAQKSIRRLRGRVAWEGDLDASRLGRVAQ
jgi:Arc/MetJ family transcription regulator